MPYIYIHYHIQYIIFEFLIHIYTHISSHKLMKGTKTCTTNRHRAVDRSRLARLLVECFTSPQPLQGAMSCASFASLYSRFARLDKTEPCCRGYAGLDVIPGIHNASRTSGRPAVQACPAWILYKAFCLNCIEPRRCRECQPQMCNANHNEDTTPQQKLQRSPGEKPTIMSLHETDSATQAYNVANPCPYHHNSLPGPHVRAQMFFLCSSFLCQQKRPSHDVGASLNLIVPHAYAGDGEI